VKKVLGILILVLFLGTVFAGMAQAQGYSEQGTTIKSESGMPNEIKPYIIVKRYTENKTINKWGGNAVQNDRYGIDLVVRVEDYAASFSGYSLLGINATLMAVGDAYSLGNNRWLKMKYLWLGASKDYLPGKLGDPEVGVEIANIKKSSGYAQSYR